MSEMWLAASLHLTDGRVLRFGPDERDDAALPSGITFDTQIPGGFGSGALTLPRPAALRADDARLFSHLRLYGPGNVTYYEGRVVGTPQLGASQARLETEGWAAHLDDNEAFREIYVDSDLSRWGPPSVQRRLNLVATYSARDGSVTPDATSGSPSLHLSFDGAWSAAPGLPLAESLYSSDGILIDSIYYAWQRVANVSSGDSNWHWCVWLANDDALAAADSSGELRAAGPGSGTVAASTASRRYAAVSHYYGAAGGTAGVIYVLGFTCLAVYGRHGLTKRGTATTTRPQGLSGGDIIGNIVERAAPLLSVQPVLLDQGAYEITHLAFREPTTARGGVEQVTALGGSALAPNDWGVYDNREFFWLPPGSYGRTWRARRDQTATLTSDGPDATSRANGYYVTYRDGAGSVHSVGPPGSGADLTTADLADTDDGNPANRIPGRWRHADVGITSQAGALLIGRLLLAEANRVTWRGPIAIEGEVMDTAGGKHPACAVRAGDRIVVEDDDPAERTIVSTSYDHDALRLTANVGAPPRTVETLLAQLAAATELAA